MLASGGMEIIMNKKLHGLILGTLIGAVLTCGAVFAKQATETIDIIYDNIKILIGGREYQPTDANGNSVEPFVYNGTTYLPVRAVATAFDKEVSWEPQTSTVTLGSKNYDWLDQMGYVDYQITGKSNVFSAIPSKTEMSDGMKYDRGIKFTLCDIKNEGTRELNDGSLECYQNISYLFNSQYKTFEGIITTNSSSNRDKSAQIKFYGDGRLIYSSPIISNGMKSTTFNVDVSNIKVLKINAECAMARNDWNYVYPCIAEARLSK